MPTIRPATTDDTIEVAGVHVRSWQVGYRGIFDDAFLDGLSIDERAKRYDFSRSDPEAPSTSVAVDDAIILGFSTVAACRDDDARGAGELQALYVEPSAWGRGLGRALLDHALDELAARGFDEVVLWVLVQNDRAQQLYRSHGFEPDGATRHEDVWGVPADVLRMRRRL